MPPAAVRPPELQGRLFRGSRAVGSGLLTRAQLRSTAWVRVYPDVYACRTLGLTHAVRTVAVTRVLLPGSVAVGRSAGVLWGRRGVPVTTPLRTALDLGRIRPPDEAVVALDQFLQTGVVALADVRAAAAALTGRDCRLVRTAADLADGLAESPQETRLRLLLHRSSLPRPVAQFRVRDTTGFVARVDLAWPEQRLAVEYDGAWHGRPGQFAADRRRLNRLLAAGWRVVFVTAADLHRPEALIACIGAALTASG